MKWFAASAKSITLTRPWTETASLQPDDDHTMSPAKREFDRPCFLDRIQVIIFRLSEIIDREKGSLLVLGSIQTKAQGCIAQTLVAGPKLCTDRQQRSRQQMGINITDAYPKQFMVVD